MAAATSLAEQLKRLAVPQTTIYKEAAKKASLLFDPKEAALKDRDTFYEIGISGFKELVALYEGFHVFEDTLFSLSSKDFERAVQSKAVNQNLDESIEKFLYQLSPYLLLQSSHKALEWLVNRYHIHEYNQDAIMGLILPYYETKIFIRLVQLMNISDPNNHWNWLQPLQKPGIPLAKQVLYNQCASNPSTLKFIAKNTLKYVKEFGERASQINTVFSFFCASCIGTIDASRLSESILNAVLPTLIKGLDSNVIDFRSSSYIVLGYLSSKSKLKQKIVDEIMDRLFCSEFDLSYDMVLLVNLIFTTQTHVTISEELLNNISVDTMNVICQHLKKLIDINVDVLGFVCKFLKGILEVLQTDSEDFLRFSQLPVIMLEELDFKQQNPETIIKCILSSYQSRKDDKTADDTESDIEIVEEISEEVINWFSKVLKSLENKYPEAFDKTIKHELSKKNKNRRQLLKLLGFKPSVSHTVGGKSLFENLNHINPDLRIEGVEYIKKNIGKLKQDNSEFLKDSIVNRFHDDNPEVVKKALEIQSKDLEAVLTSEDLTYVFVTILSRDLRNFKKWRQVINETITKFCNMSILPVTQETVLAILPHLFSYDDVTAKITSAILQSSWGKKFALTKDIKVVKHADYNTLTQAIFKSLCVNRKHNFDSILDICNLDKTKTIDLCSFMLLKSCSLKNTPVEDITNILNLLLDSIESAEIVPSTEGAKFSGESVTQLFDLARQNKILFEYMEYILLRIIEDMPVDNIAKPWCDVCKGLDTILLRKLYEICLTGCAIPTYSENYVNLLQKILERFCSNAQEKIEFVANISCGHILYAADPKDVIGPELELRSLKLISNYLASSQTVQWICDSDVIMFMILFNLNHELLVVRQQAVELMANIKNIKVDKIPIYMTLYKNLLEHKEELIMDREQIAQVLNTILVQSTNKVFKKNCMQRLFSYVVQSPAHIAAEFLTIFMCINNANAFTQIVNCLKPYIDRLQTNFDSDVHFDVYESKLIWNVCERISSSTVSTFSNNDVWSIITCLMKEYRECLIQVNQHLVSPVILINRQIDEATFKNLPEEKASSFIELVCYSGAFSNNPNISSSASKTMKKIHINFAQFSPILLNMVNAVDPAESSTKKKKSTVSMLSYQLAETREWKLGITLLEYIQSKKKMTVDNSFVSLLFQILKKCLRFDEQSYVEYTKQLILSSLWFYCHKFIDDKDMDQITSLKSIFDIELVVQCVRGTQNPQTHHHSLMLLSQAAYMLPEQVLHHTMEIFTFMGTSVLRHDDAYSFRIITKIIETLIPILVKRDRDVDEYNDKELDQLRKRVVPVLRIFADAVLHVPEHRRLPLFKKLIETLGPSQFLWVFLGLLLETDVAHFGENKEKEKRTSRSLADRESPMNRGDFGQSLILEFPPEVGIENFIKLMAYLKSLPIQKDEDAMDTDIDQSDIFSVNGHTALQLRHYKYVIITFMNNCLSSPRFIQHTTQETDVRILEDNYKVFIINILTYIQSISKVNDDKSAKYWRVMLHHSYDLLNHTNNLLSVNMFLSVVKGLMRHDLKTVIRKAMELLNSKIQFCPEFFADCDKELLYSLLPALLDIVQTVEQISEVTETAAQELELMQQTALLSLKLLTRMLAADNPDVFKPVLENITEHTCNPDICGNVMASIVLCLAELCSNLKVHALASLRKFMPALIKVLKRQRKAETPELILLSTVTAIAKIVESLPLFLSPYLEKILYEYSTLLSKWQSYDQDCGKISAIVTKLLNIKKKIAASIPPRVLIPTVNLTHQALLEKNNFRAVGPVMSVLADSFANVTSADFNTLQQDLTSFFLNALQLRSVATENNVDVTIIDVAEDEVVNALVALVLKLSENNFRPFYFKIYDWAIRTNVEGEKDRAITFYRLSSAIADKLKGLFVLFAGHFIKNAAELLDSCNKSKTEELFYESEDKCVDLVNYILKTLQIVFLYDSQNFLNKDRFETLLQPVVDQLENTLGGIDGLKTRAKELLIPCIAQFAVATADDSLWKLLNYQILLKTRHNDPEIRLTALDCLVAMASQLGSSWLPLLAESVPFLAELLEDGDSKIETATKDAIRKLEQILEEPLEKYF